MTDPATEPVTIDDFEIRREAMRLALTYGGWTNDALQRARKIERYLRGKNEE